MLADWLKRRYGALWWGVFGLCCLPAAELAWRHLQGRLGVNPLETLVRTPGRWALICLILTLAITPLRRLLAGYARRRHYRYGKRLADWNWLVRLRRMLGLWCFAYALAHAWVFLHYDLGYDGQALRDEIGEKPGLLAGAAALLMLVPLAATSTDGMMRRLGRNWRRLHRLTYIAALAGLGHFWWLVKPGLTTPWPYTLLLAVLLGCRLPAFREAADDHAVGQGTPPPHRPERRASRR